MNYVTLDKLYKHFVEWLDILLFSLLKNKCRCYTQLIRSELYKNQVFFLIDGKITKFINNHYLEFSKMSKPVFQSVLTVCFLQLVDKIMTFDEISTVSTLCSNDTYTYCQMWFTNNWWMVTSEHSKHWTTRYSVLNWM